MTAGTGVVMWLGELITDRGVGNGMSVLIFTSIAARLPSEGWHDQGDARAGRSSSLVLALGIAGHRGGGLHRAGAAPDPGAVRQAHDRPADVRRHLDLHPAEGQPGRCHPGHLRLVAALPAAAGPAASWTSNNPNAFYRFIQNYLINPTSWVNITLYFLLIIFFTYFYVGDHVQPDRGRRQHEEVRRLRARASGPASRPPSTSTSSSAGSPCPARSTWASSRSCRTCSSAWSAAASRTSRSAAPRC